MSIIHTDAFSTGIFRECQRKYDLRINKHLVAKGRTGGRSFGSVLHKGREVWRRALMNRKAPGDAFHEGMNALELEYAGLYPQGVQVDERRSLTNAKWLFSGYTSKFTNAGYTPQAIEVSFDLLVGTSPEGHTVYRTGIFDEVCEFQGRRYVLDFKTATPYPGASWFDGWRTSDQFMGYLWASRQLYGPTHGVIVHGVWVKAPAKTGRSKYKPEDYFTADIITFTDAQLEEWKHWFLRSVDRQERVRQDNSYEPSWGSACKAYQTTCDYFKWCSSDERARPMIENIYYDKIIWQPLEQERLAQIETPEAA
jgi:hypothetical protein